MATPPLDDLTAQRAIDAYARHGSKRSAAKALGLHQNTYAHQWRVAIKRGLKPTPIMPLEVGNPPDESLPVEEIIARRERQFAQLKRAKDAKRLIPVKVNLTGPIGIAHFGDPHLDDDGTDLGKVREHCEIIRRTKGLFAGNIGDGINAWTGRLARLYAEQSTSESDALRLYEWLLQQLDWLYCLGGNHLAWHSGMGIALHRWIMRECSGVFDNSSVRLALSFPNGRSVRINARHDFAGHSMWNTVHGPLKAATMGWRDHVLTCGHLHTSGYAVLKDPATGLISHAIRVSSYKTYDRYAHEKGLPNQDIFCNAVTIIDPRYADDDPRLIHVCFDVEQGADYLTWLRNRKA